AGDARLPRIRQALQRIEQALVQRAPASGVLDHLALDVFQAHALDVVHGAVQVVRLFAVLLQEGAGVFLRFLGRADLAQELRDLGSDPAVAADVDLPSRIQRDDAHVLDPAFGAVARAAGHGELDLVRAPHVGQHGFQVDAHLRAVLGAEAAELAAHAGLHRADRLAVGVAGLHSQVAPDIDQVFLAHAQQVYALAAGDLDHGDGVLVGHVGDAAQFGGIGDAALHLRHHREGAVLLDVGVRALVDEAALRVVHRLARPGREHVVVDRRAAGGAAVGRAPFHEGVGLGVADQVVLADRLAHLAVGKAGAAAHRLGLGRLLEVGAQAVHQDLLDQAGARAAGAGGLGVLLDLVHGEQALLAHRLDDGALAHAVAAADLIGVGHGRGAVLAGGAGLAHRGLAESQGVAAPADRGAVLDLLEVPGAVGGVAVQAGPDQAVIADHQLAVPAGGRIRQHDLLGPLPAHEVAGGEQVDAGDLELGRHRRALVDTDAEGGQVVGADLRLLEQRRDQAVRDAAVRRAFAHRVHPRVVGLQGVVDHDAAVAVDAGGLGQGGVGTDARGHDHQVGGDLPAVGEAHRGHFASLVADDLRGRGVEPEVQPALAQRLLQQRTSHRVELALQQPAGQVHHGHLHAALPEAVGRLQPEQPTADHHRVPLHLRGLDHGAGVVDVAVADDALQVLAGDRQDERHRTGGQQQAVVLGLGAVGRHHPAAHAVEPGELLAQVEGDAVVRVPGQRIEHDVVEVLLAGQHRRQQDAVVVGMRRGAEHRDVVHRGHQLQQLLERADAGHAVAHHHQPGLLHRVSSLGPCRARVMNVEQGSST